MGIAATTARSSLKLEMQKVSKEASTPPVSPTLAKITSRPNKTLTKIMLLPFRNGEAVSRHPEIAEFLKDGWTVSSAVPRIVESQGTKLLVVLVKPGQGARLTRIK